MTPPEEPRVSNDVTEKNPLLGPIVFVPAVIFLILAIVVFVVMFW